MVSSSAERIAQIVTTWLIQYHIVLFPGMMKEVDNKISKSAKDSLWLHCLWLSLLGMEVLRYLHWLVLFSRCFSSAEHGAVCYWETFRVIAVALILQVVHQTWFSAGSALNSHLLPLVPLYHYTIVVNLTTRCLFTLKPSKVFDNLRCSLPQLHKRRNAMSCNKALCAAALGQHWTRLWVFVKGNIPMQKWNRYGQVLTVEHCM